MKFPAALAVAILCAGPLPGGQMVVFGDSLSDGGYFLGERFTDPGGDLWHEYLADRLGLGRATVGGFLGSQGLNLAVGGATVSGGGISGNLQDQVNRYIGRHTWQAGDLCTVWIGGNDLRDDPAQDMGALASGIGAIIAQLTALGIDHFMVPNLPDLGAVPESLRSPELIAPRSEGTIAFNAALEFELGVRAAELGVTIDRLDVYGIFEQMLANPGDYGFTNITGTLEENPGADPDEFAFWDLIHPTTRSHFLIAGAAHAVLDPAGAGIEIVSWSIGSGGALRQTWLADPGRTYWIVSGTSPDGMTPAGNFTGSPAYTVVVAAPGPFSGFFQTRSE